MPLRYWAMSCNLQADTTRQGGRNRCIATREHDSLGGTMPERQTASDNYHVPQRVSTTHEPEPPARHCSGATFRDRTTGTAKLPTGFTQSASVRHEPTEMIGRVVTCRTNARHADGFRS